MELRPLPALAALLLACASTQPAIAPASSEDLKAETPRAAGPERVGDVAVVPLGGGSFDRLEPAARVLAYHLAQAAMAAHPIIYLQQYRHGLAIWELIDALAARSDLFDPQFTVQLRDYRRRVFLHRGIHDAGTQLKFLPDFTAEELTAAVERAREEGARLPEGAALRELERAMFDPNGDRVRLEKIPGTLRDPLAESAIGHYAAGISSWDLTDFVDQHPLGSRVSRSGGATEEELYRAGGSAAEPGLGSAYLIAAAAHLDAAVALAGPGQREALRQMAAAVRSGDGAALQRVALWGGSGRGLELAFGFGGMGSDPREQKGHYEGILVVHDPAWDARLRRVAEMGPEMAELIPELAQQYRGGWTPPTVEVVDLASAAGGALAFAPLGLGWPGRPPVDGAPAGKRWLALSLGELEERALGTALIREFVMPEVSPEAVRCAGSVRAARAAYRELFGHAWGKLGAAEERERRRKLAPYDGVLDAVRAEAMADLLLEDSRAVASGLLPDAGCQQVSPYLVAMEAFTAPRRTPLGDRPRASDEQRALVMLQAWQVDQGAVELMSRGGRHHARAVSDGTAWRRGLQGLLTAVQEILSAGDRAGAEKLVDRYGLRFDPKLRDEVLARMQRMHIPWRMAYLPPILEPVRDPSGEIADIRIRPARDLDEVIGAFGRAGAGR